jgi:hypothetical protein
MKGSFFISHLRQWVSFLFSRLHTRALVFASKKAQNVRNINTYGLSSERRQCCESAQNNRTPRSES